MDGFTDSIAHDASASSMEMALESLSNIGDVLVSRSDATAEGATLGP